jgi:hypothetical protein
VIQLKGVGTGGRVLGSKIQRIFVEKPICLLSSKGEHYSYEKDKDYALKRGNTINEKHFGASSL